eukprot:scaffold657223_cov48-Prasinocladus_malaysianus.AAC.1
MIGIGMNVLWHLRSIEYFGGDCADSQGAACCCEEVQNPGRDSAGEKGARAGSCGCQQGA